MACSLLLHPVVITVIHQLAFISIAGFTPHHSVFRPLGFVFLLISSIAALSTWEIYVEPGGWVARTVASAFPQIALTYFERMIVRGIAFSPSTTFATATKNGTLREPPVVSAGLKQRYMFGQSVASSMRGLGTSWEVKNIHPFDAANPAYVPPRGRFIVQALVRVVLCWYMHRMCIVIQLRLDQTYITPEHVAFFRRIGDISVAELRVRYIATLTTVGSIYCFIQGGYHLAAAVCVMLNQSAVKDWRPVFGDVTEACRLRHFWAVFWHQGLQSNLRGTARWICNNIFGLRSPSVPSRYLKVLIAFFLSGVVHVPADMGSAVPASQSGAIQFFTTQIAGLMIEDVLEPWLEPVAHFLRQKKIGRLVVRLIGYCWVITFLAWSGPVRWFAVIRVQTADAELIGLNAFRSLGKGLDCLVTHADLAR